MATITISCFADEIDPELSVQLDLLESEGIRWIALRNVWARNVCDLTDAELLRVRRETAARGFGFSSIGSPIGKVKLSAPFEPHLERFRRAVTVAKVLDAPYIRIFSFYGEDMEPPLAHRTEVLSRLNALVDEVKGCGVTLVLENEHGLYGQDPERCRDLLEGVASPLLRQAFDPGNFVYEGIKPYDRAWPLLADHIAYLHVKDMDWERREHVVFGEGGGQARAILESLKARGYAGFATLEPHLLLAQRLSGFSGRDGVRSAARALRRCLSEVGYEWN